MLTRMFPSGFVSCCPTLSHEDAELHRVSLPCPSTGISVVSSLVWELRQEEGKGPFWHSPAQVSWESACGRLCGRLAIHETNALFPFVTILWGLGLASVG